MLRGHDRELEGKRTRMLLEHKNAVVYGGAGSIGGAVARAFAHEGARVFLAGRTLATLEEVAEELSSAGGAVETALLDALDEQAVDEHADAVAEKAGGIDVSFNAISHGDVHGASLLEMPFEDFARPITVAMRAQFLTTRAAARHMTRQGSGVIMTITATTARLAIPEIGGTGVTFDAIESQCRQWACELGRRGVRVVWLQTTGLPEGLADIEVFPGYGTGSGNGMTRGELIAWMQGSTHLNRLTSLAEVGSVAAFMASDHAAAMTATAVNLSCGQVPAR
jgi:3-oxoacyl-[acyl-carrier protein] reductase